MYINSILLTRAISFNYLSATTSKALTNAKQKTNERPHALENALS